jgi:hypothetical protein
VQNSASVIVFWKKKTKDGNLRIRQGKQHQIPREMQGKHRNYVEPRKKKKTQVERNEPGRKSQIGNNPTLSGPTLSSQTVTAARQALSKYSSVFMLEMVRLPVVLPNPSCFISSTCF